MKKMCVYILQCSDGSYYTGVTNSLNRRIAEHENGKDSFSYTFSRRPLKLVFVQYFNDPENAIRLEKQIKGWTRKKKEALIKENWEALQKLSICKNETNYEISKKNQRASLRKSLS